MRSSLSKVLFAPSTPWKCRQCIGKQNLGRSKFKQYASFATKVESSGRVLTWRRAAYTFAGTSAVLGAGGYYYREELKHAYKAAQRTSRVAVVLFANVWDYRRTLKEPCTKEELAACHKRCANRTLKAIEKNGSIFIKLGQHLSSMGYLLPLEWTETFIPLQDKCPISTYESIEEMFIEDTGNSISNLFSTFERVPIGSASLAQVHRATLKDTREKVAVKVQHPELKEWVPLDMNLTRFTFATLAYWFPEYDLTWLSSEMEFSLPQELDFEVEGRNAMRTKAYFSKINDAPLLIPEVKFGMKRILVMEFMGGHRPDDLEYIDSNGIDRDEVSAALSRVFNEMIFGDRAPLHCDPHGGNIAIRKNHKRSFPNFDIILYDHGLYRDIPIQLKRDYAKLWLAVIDADEPNMRKYAKAVAGISDEQFPLFASAITGRDYRVVTKSVVTERTDQERDEISGALGEGMLEQLVQLLGQVPRIILLILKTNDLSK
jgi:aarF domain-containing kinase